MEPTNTPEVKEKEVSLPYAVIRERADGTRIIANTDLYAKMTTVMWRKAHSVTKAKRDQRALELKQSQRNAYELSQRFRPQSRNEPSFDVIDSRGQGYELMQPSGMLRKKEGELKNPLPLNRIPFQAPRNRQTTFKNYIK